MPVDSSPYTASPAVQQDPLASVGKILQIQQGAVALQSQMQELKARQALGPILQRSIDPKTGELDTNRFFIEGSADPDVAWKMPDIVHQMLQNDQIKADTALKQMAVSKQQWEMTTGIAQGLTTKAIEAASGKGKVDPATGKWIPAIPQLSHKEIASGLADLVAAGGMDAKDAAEFLARNAMNSPQQNFQMIDRIMKSGQNIDQGLARLTGAIKSYNTGGEQTFTQEVPATGEVRNVGHISNTPTVESRNAGVKGINAKGQPTEQPRYQAYPMVDGAGRPIAGSPTAGSMVTGLSPMDTKLQEARAANAAKTEEDMDQAVLAGRETMRIVNTMREELRNFKPGGGAKIQEKLAKLVQGMGGSQELTDIINGGDLGSKQAVQKLAFDLAAARMRSSFGNAQRFTNMDFSSAMKTSPNEEMDPRALDRMFSFIRTGANRMLRMQDEYNRWKRTPAEHLPPGYEGSDISAFPNYWANVLDAVEKRKQQALSKGK